jgi:hypothetical protein
MGKRVDFSARTVSDIVKIYFLEKQNDNFIGDYT